MYTAKLWESSQDVITKIYRLPFLLQLQNGTLPEASFKFYLQQDALYLLDFSRALAITATKAPTVEQTLLLYDFASGALRYERALHQDYLGDTAPVEPTAACFSYTHMLLSSAYHRTYWQSIAALLPCFWIYAEVANYLFPNLAQHTPYRHWVEAYVAPEFTHGVERLCKVVDKAPISNTEFETMIELFRAAVILEYRFWDEVPL